VPVSEVTVRTTQDREIVDITGLVGEVVSVFAGEGLVCISVPHCTCGVYVNENEDGLVEDMLAAVERVTAGVWQHDRIDNNAAAHIGASLIGNSVSLPLRGGKLVLGTWQRIMLVELDGPRRRTVHLTVVAA
jgi:secondary thiamine-phosphate synthase enzyme